MTPSPPAGATGARAITGLTLERVEVRPAPVPLRRTVDEDAVRRYQF